MPVFEAGMAKELGLFDFEYNRAAFAYDADMRWKRFVAGREFACKQVDLFREDVEDLTYVVMNKLKNYGLVLTFSIGCIFDIYAEGRFGTDKPAPPSAFSGLWLQSLAIGLTFLTLATWLTFHAALRAQVAALQLRTRKVRLPVPSQCQLDNARKLLSSYEEQSVYDILRVPLVMPQPGSTPKRREKPAKKHMFSHKGRSSYDSGPEDSRCFLDRFPGLTGGVPRWGAKEFEERDARPGASPSGFGLHGPAVPYEHFEYVRQAQKDWWSAEAYSRIGMLYGMMHMLMGAAYWMMIDCQTEMALAWVSITVAVVSTLAVALIFRLDVLPDRGGGFAIEFSSPVVAAVGLMLTYEPTPTKKSVDAANAIGIICTVMHILQVFRMYSIAKPSNNAPTTAMESGGRIFNRSAACEAPSWLPSSFQVVMYLIAPPTLKDDTYKGIAVEDVEQIEDDSEGKVDMTPWYYTRAHLMMVGLGWVVLLIGHLSDLQGGERSILSTPGMPPWTRVGRWFGFEHGPTTTKDFAMVAPMAGHYAFQRGWGPQGQQDIWPSDLFGFHPEADSWWIEGGEAGAAGVGGNTWQAARLKYGTFANVEFDSEDVLANDLEVKEVGELHAVESDATPGDTGDERRLRRSNGALTLSIEVQRTMVPVVTEWPLSLQPVLLACGADVAVLTHGGFGVLVHSSFALGSTTNAASKFSLEGLSGLGHARGVAWTNGGLHLIGGSGQIASCVAPGGAGAGPTWSCQLSRLPPLPFQGRPAVLLVSSARNAATPQAVVSIAAGWLVLYELAAKGSLVVWQQIDSVHLDELFQNRWKAGMQEPIDVVAVTSSLDEVVATTSNGVVVRLTVGKDGRNLHAVAIDIPTTTDTNRGWRAACSLSNGDIIRLAEVRDKQVGAVGAAPELVI